MSQRDGYEHGVPCWVAAMQPDLDRATDFYGGLFGWEFAPMDPGGRAARRRGRVVAGLTPLPPGGETTQAAWTTHVQVDSADAIAAHATELGGEVIFGPTDYGRAGRLAVLRDPTGATLCAFQPAERRGAELVNEPGAWAMSSLRTPDPATAEAFYCALFGWTTEAFDLGEETITMFRLPGYVGGEPEQPVSREVVATMSEQTADGRAAGVPAHWHVGFWTEDADTAAQRATALGGRTVAPPTAGGAMRTAVLADPHGAVFSVTQVGPPA